MQHTFVQGSGPRIDRRSFLRVGGGLAIGSQLAPGILRAASEETRGAHARSCILVYLLGGPPHLDMWDLKPEAPAEIRGPFKAIATETSGLAICEHLPRLARLSDQYAIVRSVSHNNHNHTPMIYYSLTGRDVEQPQMDNDVRPPERNDFPHLGAVLAKAHGRSGALPGYVAIPQLAVRSSLEGEFKRARPALRGGGGGFLGPLFDPLCVDGEPGRPEAVPALRRPDDVSGEQHERRAQLLSLIESRRAANNDATSYDVLREQAVLLTGSAGGSADAFSLNGEPPRLRERYGNHRFGRAMLLARRLSEAGVAMTAIHFNEMTICDGWDTHSKNFAALESELLPMLDQGLSALLTDLAERGRLDETLVVVMGEFGRTPKINAAAGRDHWGSCQSVVLAGGGIRGGAVFGSSDKIGAYPASHPVDPVDVHATIYHCMGLDPHVSMTDNLGRAFELCTGTVIKALV